MSNKQIEEMAKCCTYHSNGECCADATKICACDLMCEMFGVFANLENAGYRKRSEGEWKYPPYAPFGGSYEMKRCSVCGYKPDFDSDNPYTKYCPNCGAKMKGGE